MELMSMISVLSAIAMIFAGSQLLKRELRKQYVR
jgi:hypothetical protein